MNIKLYPPLAIHELGQRGNQEDTIYPAKGKATAEDCLFIVCDGMGGHEHGEVASETFATALARFFEGRVSPDVVLTDQTLADAIEAAYLQLDAVDDGNFKKMGTTLTLMYFHRGGVTAAHIGDSRIYHIRPGVGPLYVSRDHSLVYDLYRSGEITFEEIRTSRHRNIITRAVQPGEENRVRPDVIHITDVQPGDYFYLCSDGMLEQMDDEELVKILSGTDSDEQKRQRLVEATAGNKDNHSAYLIRVEAVEREKDDVPPTVNEEKTARCNALNLRAPATGSPSADKAPASDSERGDVPDKVPEVSSPPPVPPAADKKGKSCLWPLLALVALLAVAGGAAYYWLHGTGHGEASLSADTVTVVTPLDPTEEPPVDTTVVKKAVNPADSAVKIIVNRRDSIRANEQEPIE